MMKRPKRVLVIGFDGLVPDFVEKFAAEGNLPNMAAMMERGVFAEALPSPPVDTPTNWTTIATGAWTGTHGNNTFGLHIEGEPFDKFHGLGPNIFPQFADVATEHLSHYSNAEYIWQAAERASKRSILLNWPGGWPPLDFARDGPAERALRSSPEPTEGPPNAAAAPEATQAGGGVITVDGSGPYSSKLSRLSTPHVFSSEGGEGRNRLTVRPGGKAGTFETALLLSGEGNLVPGGDGWEIADAPEGAINADLRRALYIAIADSRVTVSRKLGGEPLCVLTAGEWSDWLSAPLATPWREVPAWFRLRVESLSADGRSLTIYRTTLFNLDGWAYPDGLARELVDLLFAEGRERGTDGTKDDVPRIMPLCQVRESIEEQCLGIAMMARHLNATRPWDLMMVQVHAPDGLNHEIMNGICPIAPQYDPAKEEETWGRFRSQYQVLDRMVGNMRQIVDDGETAIIVLSDHGAIPTWKRAWLGRAFEAAGLITLEPAGEGQIRPDYSRSKVAIGDHPLAQNIWVNLKGRDPQGIVEPGEEYERVRDEALRVLRSFTDPETGEHVIALALRKEEAECLGQWGPRVGDIIYFFAPGYTDKIRVFSAGTMNESDLPANGVEPNADGMQGYHHPYLPTARAFGCTARATFLAAGPGFKAGYRRQAPIGLVEVTPTVAYLLGFPPPAQAEGGVVTGLLNC